MAMPNHLVLVRHGESEGNFVREAFKQGAEGDLEFLINEFRERPGPELRLTDKGVEQARAAGLWIQENIIAEFGLPGFDRYVYSPHRRTKETAGHLGIPGAEWRLNRMLRERAWGEIENLTGESEHERLYPNNYRFMQRDPLNWAPPGGESIVQVADTRVRGVLDSMHRDHDEKDIDSYLVSTHGEWIWAARLVLEYMHNEDWDRTKNDPLQRIHNCQVLHYTRLDPETGEQAPYLRWMRSVNPYREETEGQWHELYRRTLTNEELIESAEDLPRLRLGKYPVKASVLIEKPEAERTEPRYASHHDLERFIEAWPEADARKGGGRVHTRLWNRLARVSGVGYSLGNNPGYIKLDGKELELFKMATETHKGALVGPSFADPDNYSLNLETLEMLITADELRKMPSLGAKTVRFAEAYLASLQEPEA